MNSIVAQRIRESIDVKQLVLEDTQILTLVETLSKDIIEALRSGHKVFFAGNGGSFSDSFHLAGEFISRFMFDRAPLPAIALGGNNSILSAIGNDYSFDDVFDREIAALGLKGDIFIAISTSGNSRNIIKAVETANKMGIKTYGFSGRSGGRLKDCCQCIRIPSDITARIQESHIMIGHIICEIVEKEIFNN